MALGKKEKFEKTQGEDPVIDPSLDSLMDDRCPNCGGNKFLIGPEAGLSHNIECKGCGIDFNVTLFNGKLIFAEWVGYNNSRLHEKPVFDAGG